MLPEAGGCAEPAQKIKKTITAPGDLSPKLYSGTFNHLATWLSDISQKPTPVKSHVTCKIYKRTAL
jgi:hypothetical protein